MGMDILVRGRQRMPHTMSAERRTELRQAEGRRAQELIEEGLIKRIWRAPGQTGSWTLWHVVDIDQLDAALQSLPLYPWYDLQAIPLASDGSAPVAAG